MRQHTVQLLRFEPAQQAGGDAEHGVVRVAPGGEGVRQLDVGDRDPGLGHVGHGAQPVDGPVQLRLLLGGHLVGVHGEQGDPVGVPVLGADQAADHYHHQGDGLQQHDQCRDERHVQQPEQEYDGHHPDVQLPVGAEAGAWGGRLRGVPVGPVPESRTAPRSAGEVDGHGVASCSGAVPGPVP